MLGAVRNAFVSDINADTGGVGAVVTAATVAGDKALSLTAKVAGTPFVATTAATNVTAGTDDNTAVVGTTTNNVKFGQAITYAADKPSVAQVDTVAIDVESVIAEDIFTVTIDGIAVSIPLGGAVNSQDVRDALIDAINADPTIGGSVTAAAGTFSTLTLIANSAGVPFTATASLTSAFASPDNSISATTTTGNFTGADNLGVGETLTDTFIYAVSDGQGGNDTVSVTMTITGTNDAPIAVADGAGNDVINVAEDSSTIIDVLANDSDPDGDPLAITLATQGAKGGVLVNADGTITYTAGSTFNSLAVGETGSDSFSYTIQDGQGGLASATVTVTVDGVNDGPDALDDGGLTFQQLVLNVAAADGVLSNDVDPDTNDTLTVTDFSALTALGATVNVSADGSYTYDPNSSAIIQALAADQTATDTFTYTILDSQGATDTATVTLSVSSGRPIITVNVTDGDTVTLTDGAVDNIVAGTGNDTITFATAADDGDTFVGGDGLDTLILDGGNDNTLDVFTTETVTGGAANDALDLGSVLTAGTVIDLDGGADSVELAAGASSATLLNIETITGTFAGETLTLANNLAGVAIDFGLGSDALNLAAGSNTISATGTEAINGTTGCDTLTLTNAQAGTAIDLGAATDILNLSDGDDVVSVSNIETVTGGAGNDTVTLASDLTGGAVDLGAGNDTLVVGGVSASLTADGVENFQGSAGNDSLTFGNVQSGVTVDLGAGTDTLNLNGGDNAVTVAGAESITSGAGNDRVDLSAPIDGATIDLGAGADKLTLADGGNTLSAVNTESVSGGAGDDTITVTGEGASVVTGGAGNDTLISGDDGNDILDGGSGVDTASFAASGTGVNIDLNDAGKFLAPEAAPVVEPPDLAEVLTASLTGNLAGFTALAGNDTFEGNTQAGKESASAFASVDLGTVGGTVFSLSAGILVTSGDGTPSSTNTESGSSGTASGTGSAALGEAGAQGVLTDSTVLTFDFTVPVGVTAIAFDWMFGTDEFPEHDVADFAAVKVDGTNYLSFEDGSPVQFLQDVNEQFFTDNAGGALAIEYDGVTAPVQMVALLDTSLTTHTITVGVTDTEDKVIDSGLFLSATAFGFDATGATAGADFLVGNFNGETIDGLGGDDRILGFGGNDSLVGGAGNDTLDGGDGSDTLDGGAGDDVFIASKGTDVIRTGGGTDTLVIGAGFEVESVLATALDISEGSFDLQFTLEDAGGFLHQTTVSLNSAPLDVVQVDIDGDGTLETFSLGGLVDLNALTFDASASTVATALAGTIGDDVITGGAFGDVLSGNAGNDTLLGGGGDDLLIGGDGIDIFEGGAGVDTVEYSEDTGLGVTVNLLAGTASDEFGGADALANVENVIGSDFADSITGDGAANLLEGEGGNDVLDGGAGDDVLDGNSGNDVLTGGIGNDVLDGGLGDDTLDGGLGDDVIVASAGNDTVIADGGNDTVDFGDTFVGGITALDQGEGDFRADFTVFDNSGGSSTTSVNFGNSSNVFVTLDADNDGTAETLHLVGVSADTAEDSLVVGGLFNNVLTGNVGDDVLLGASGNDTITGGGGADRFDGGFGDDTLIGGAGDDVFVASAGNDVVQTGGGQDTLDLGFRALLGTELVDADGDGQDDDLLVSIDDFGFPGSITVLDHLTSPLTSITGFELTGDGGPGPGPGGDFGPETLRVAPSLSDTGASQDTVLVGTANSETVSAGSGDDLVFASGGDDTISGGAGTDTLSFGGLGVSSGSGVRVDLAAGTVEDANAPAGNVVDLNGLDGSDGLRFLYTGNSIVGIGDINGDTFDDFVINENYDSIATETGNDFLSGINYVIFGGPNLGGLDNADGSLDGRIDPLQIRSSATDFGVIVAGGNTGRDLVVGDIDGDGVDDLIAGSPSTIFDSTGNDALYSSGAYVVFSGTAGANLQGLADSVNVADLTSVDGNTGFVIGTPSSSLGFVSVASAGDIDGDNFDDIFMSSPYDSVTVGNDTLDGVTYLVFGGEDNLDVLDGNADGLIDASAVNGTTGFILAGESMRDVSAVGDINGDNFDDIVVTVPYGTYVGGQGTLTKDYLIFGGSANLTALDGDGDGIIDVRTVPGTGGFVFQGYQGMGYETSLSVASAGDINGDGVDDLLIGALSTNFSVPGAAYLVFGGSANLTALDGDGDGDGDGIIDVTDINGTNGFILAGDRSTGSSVAGGGDFNGDGIADIVIGSPYAVYTPYGSLSTPGATHVVFGGASLGAADAGDGSTDGTITLNALDTANGVILDGLQTGHDVSFVGDVDNDGFDDVALDSGNGSGGTQYLVFGFDPSGQADAGDIIGIENLTGTGFADTLIGDDGNNVLKGGAGCDTLIGGDGDDVIIGGIGDDNISGGSGNDTLVFEDFENSTIDGGDGVDTFDLSSFFATGSILLGESNVQNIEVVDLGSNAVTLEIDASDAINLTDANNTLTIKGDNGVLEDFSPGRWTAFGVETVGGEDFNVFKQGDATLRVDVDIDASALSLTQSIDLRTLSGDRGVIIEGLTGEVVSSAGDFNGDGIDDFVIATNQYYADGASSPGAAFVVFGGPTLATLDADGDGVVDITTLDAAHGVLLTGGFIGSSVSSAGDVNGDGIDDLLVSSGAVGVIIPPVDHLSGVPRKRRRHHRCRRPGQPRRHHPRRHRRLRHRGRQLRRGEFGRRHQRRRLRRHRHRRLQHFLFIRGYRQLRRCHLRGVRRRRPRRLRPDVGRHRRRPHRPARAGRRVHLRGWHRRCPLRRQLWRVFGGQRRRHQRRRRRRSPHRFLRFLRVWSLTDLSGVWRRQLQRHCRRRRRRRHRPDDGPRRHRRLPVRQRLCRLLGELGRRRGRRRLRRPADHGGLWILQRRRLLGLRRCRQSGQPGPRRRHRGRNHRPLVRDPWSGNHRPSQQ